MGPGHAQASALHKVLSTLGKYLVLIANKKKKKNRCH